MQKKKKTLFIIIKMLKLSQVFYSNRKAFTDSFHQKKTLRLSMVKNFIEKLVINNVEEERIVKKIKNERYLKENLKTNGNI